MNRSQRNLNIEIQHRLMEELTRSNEELRLINEFTVSVQEGYSTDRVLFILCKLCIEQLSCGDCCVWLTEKNSTRLIKMMAHCSDNILPVESHAAGSQKSGNPLVSMTAITMEPQFERSPQMNSNGSSKSDNSGNFTFPLLYQNSLVGVIALRHDNSISFKKNHFNSLLTIATIAATKLMQTRHFEEISNYQKQLEEYIHVISHDLKSPLRSINALVSWIKEDNHGNLNNSTLQNFKMIDDTLFQMENLIDGTLNYSKIGYEDMVKETIDLNDIIDDIKMALIVPDHIEIQKQKTLPVVMGVRTHFVQIYQNLLSNAIKYNDKVEGQIVLNWKETEDCYIFSVKDNGIGIPKQYQGKIFEIFQSLNAKTESSGIGLSIVKKLVRLNQGEIWVKSIEAKGSTFYFSIKKF
ncbi:MAG: GHKL domain-containing protein [Bacteroidia bacterium]|nr:GHKL domain-containing protein [Bacteroidia bacterium]